MDEPVKSSDNSWNQSKRSGAEKCFNIAVENVKHGNQKEAELFLLRAVTLLDTMDHYGVQKDKCFPSSSVDEIRNMRFKDLLRRKNITFSEKEHSKSNGETFVSSNKAEEISNLGYDEGHNQDTVADLNGNERTGDYLNNRFVKFSYADPRASCMETLGSSLFDSDNDIDNWNKPPSDSPWSEPEEMDRTIPSLSTSSETRASLRIAVGNCCFTLLRTSKAFMKRAWICSKEHARVMYEKLMPILNLFWRIFFLALCFVYLIAYFTLTTVWEVVKFILGILVYLSRLVSCSPSRVQHPSRRHKQKPYIATKELPKTSEEAVRHLLACENSDNFYETLLVDENAPQEDIKRNFKQLALLVHPDKLVSKGDSTQSAIKILNAAYKALRDKPKGDQHVSCSRGSFPCSRCGGRHVVIKTDRNPMLGRYCRFCDRYHKVYDGEAWIEGSIWAKDFYFCKTDGVVGPQVYKFASWGECESAQFGEAPINSHYVFIKLESETHNNYPNQHESKRRCSSGKKNRRRKSKK